MQKSASRCHMLLSAFRIHRFDCSCRTYNADFLVLYRSYRRINSRLTITPIIGTSNSVLNRISNAAELAVPQAITIIFTSNVLRKNGVKFFCIFKQRFFGTRAVRNCPYHQKYIMSSFGNSFIICFTAVSPPSPESKTPIHLLSIILLSFPQAR